MKRILITGANGFLGQKLVELLIKKTDLFIIATGIGVNRISFSGEYIYQSMDITNRQVVLETIRHLRPDIVIHGAAMTDADRCEVEKTRCWKHNVHAVEYIVEACDTINAFLLYISTDFIFDGLTGPYDENSQPNPINFYGESKQAGELVVRKSNLRWSIVRTMLLYGTPHYDGRSNIVTWIKQTLEEGKKIKVVDDQWRTPTLIDDLAVGCYMIIDKVVTGIFNISGYEIFTPYDLATRIARYFGLDKSLITRVDTTKLIQVARRPQSTILLIDKARNELQYNPKTFDEGLAMLSS
ncbi:SDR family oxidoreductase [Spirosoma oryzicola]|uniref:SDR family oxidoreductase n=1 Tax=Spirosoma oryzicola TaxID=2898794 RepID=UPI001E6475BF|nr:SDR family oxidoreductase [Spirosoma oryzicola]UHG94866.1 SDR family oxidoreductase [Spirosoma oryzicola]